MSKSQPTTATNLRVLPFRSKSKYALYRVGIDPFLSSDDATESSGSRTTIGESAGVNPSAGVPRLVIVGGQTVLDDHPKEATDDEEEDICGPPPKEIADEDPEEESPEKPKKKTKRLKSTSPRERSRTSGRKSSTKSATSYSPTVDSDPEAEDEENHQPELEHLRRSKEARRLSTIMSQPRSNKKSTSGGTNDNMELQNTREKLKLMERKHQNLQDMVQNTMPLLQNGKGKSKKRLNPAI